MKTLVKTLALLVLCGGLLAGCNGAGGNSNSENNTQNIATVKVQQKAHKILPNNQKLLRISNKTGSVISSISIVSKSGQLIYQSNSGLDCANNQTCVLGIGEIATDKSMLIKFYNSKNQLISMAGLKDNSQKLTYMTVYTNSTIFGTKLFKQLVIFENSTPKAVYAQLTKYFKHSAKSQNIDLFEELGNYYSQQLKNGSITSEEHFYQSLNAAFVKHVTVTAPPASPQLTMAPPMLGCSDNSTGATVYRFLSPFSKISTSNYGNWIGGIVDMSNAIFNLVCPVESFDFEGAFDELNEKLDKIQTSLDALDTNVAALRTILLVLDEDNTKVSMQELYDAENLYNAGYINFLFENNVKSLSEFAAARGGIDQLDRETWGPIFFDASEGLVGSISIQNSNITRLTSSAVLNRLSDQLQFRCAGYNNKGIPDVDGKLSDVFTATDLCNIQTVQIGFYLASLVDLAQLRMLDVAHVINTSNEPGQYKNNFDTKIKWADVPNTIAKDTESRLNIAFDFMKNNVFTPHIDLLDMNITIEIPTDCITTKFKRTKVFHPEMKLESKSYDSITVEISCGVSGTTITRPLLPGGQYHVDKAANKIVMDNAFDWEINSTINPFIPKNSVPFSGLSVQGGDAYYNFSPMGAFIQEYRNNNFIIPATCHSDTNTPLVNRLITEGRDEFSNSMSAEGIMCRWLVHYEFRKTRTPIKFYIAQNGSDITEFTAYRKNTLINGIPTSCIQGIPTSIDCGGIPDNRPENRFYNYEMDTMEYEYLLKHGGGAVRFEGDYEHLSIQFYY